MSAPRIVWPAPLLPALIEEGRPLTILVSHRGDTRQVADWCRSLSLRSARDQAHVRLDLVAVEPSANTALPGFVHGRVEMERSAALYEARFAIAPFEIAAPRTAAVFDIVAGETAIRRNAVASLARAQDSLRLAFATDIHVARIWDELDAAVSRHAPDLYPGFLHPGRSLELFVDEINARAARGEIDLVVFGGDLVDHVHDERRGGTANGGNVRRFCDAVARLEVPAFAVPGNHDYRLHPWRPRLPNLESVGLPGSRSRAILRAAGLWDAWPFRLSDTQTLATQEPDGRSGLAHHLAEIAPATDYALDVRGVRLIFASTGRDVFPQWRQLEWARRGLLLRSANTSIEDPDCEGLSEEQLRLLDGAVRGASGVALFQHAPLLHTGNTKRMEHCLARLDPGERDDLGSRIAFERDLHRAGVRRGVFFRNPAPFLRTLLAARGPFALLSGHVHRGTASLVGRRSLALRSAPMEAPASSEDLSFFTGPSLAHRRYRRDESQAPGYLLARFDDGRLAHLEQRGFDGGAGSSS